MKFSGVLGRIAAFSARNAGAVVVLSVLLALAAGLLATRLDTDTGTFSWQPSAGFIGTYPLLFVRTLPGGETSRIPVQVRITPRFDVSK